MVKVKVYSADMCPWCVRVKDFLKEHNVEFEKINVGTDQEKGKEMVRKSGQTGVPVVDVDGQIVIGFDEAKLRQLLNL